MKRWEITGKGTGAFYGVYEGETPKDAVKAMLKDASCDEEPNMRNWYVEEVRSETESTTGD